MDSLRGLFNESVYIDDPYFSDQVLLPAIAKGHSVTLVSAFAPSYLYRLINDLANSPEIEPGKLNVVFCIPFQSGGALPPARLLSKYLSAFAENSDEVKRFIKAINQLVNEGGLTLSALYSHENTMLTPSCIGIVESTEFGSTDYSAFIDKTAGDRNSPIPMFNSWDQDRQSLAEITSLVHKATNEVFSTLLRVSHNEVMDLLVEILKKGYSRLEFKDDQPRPTKKRSSSPGKTRSKSKVLIEDDSDQDDDELWELELDDLFIEDYKSELEILDGFIAQLDSIDSVLLASIEDFLESEYVDPWDYEGEVEPRHAGPLPFDLVQKLGHEYATCWCGKEYDRLDGCPDY